MLTSIDQPVANSADPSRSHLPALDGVRGAAILLVLVRHYTQELTLAPSGLLARVAHAAAMYGWSGVDLFFVLSGFLITALLLASRDAPRYFRTFYARRALRIFPLYYALLILLVVVVPIVGRVLGGNAERAGGDTLRFVVQHQTWYWTYLSNILAVREAPTVIPLFYLWSLAVEEQFYIVWPAVVYLVRSERGLLYTCVAGIVGAIAVRLALVLAHAPFAAMYVLPISRADSLLTGALIALAVRRKADIGAALRTWLGPSALVAGVLLVILTTVSNVWPAANPIMYVGQYSVNALVAAALVVGAVTARTSTLVARFWTSKFLRFFGRYSYGIYILHPFLLARVSRGWGWVTHHPDTLMGTPIGRGLFVVAGFAVYMAAAVAFALVSWTVLERPAMRLKKYFGKVTSSGSNSRATDPSVLRGAGDLLPES